MRAEERAEDAFHALGRDLLREPRVHEGTGFGKSPGLRVGDHVFAMLVHGELVVKLPRERCEELVDSGAASVFTVGKRRMREWAAVDVTAASQWRPLAYEALAFVGGPQG